MIRQTPWPSPRDSLLLSDEAPFFQVHFLCVDALKKNQSKTESRVDLFFLFKGLKYKQKKTKQHFCSVQYSRDCLMIFPFKFNHLILYSKANHGITWCIVGSESVVCGVNRIRMVKIA